MTHYALCWTVHGDCDLCCNGVYDCLNLTWNHALLLASVLISDAMNTRPLVSRATKRMWAICSDFDVWMLRFVEIVILFNLIHHIIFSLLLLWLCIPFLGSLLCRTIIRLKGSGQNHHKKFFVFKVIFDVF
jgi:hypothetical protein